MTQSMIFGGVLGRAALMAALVAATATAASAETPPAPAQGWQALIGCWEPVAPISAPLPDSTRGHMVCVLPVDGSSSLDFVTIADGRATERERVDATGTRQPLTRDDCSGWQSAEWSAGGHRLFLRSELTCTGGLKRTSTGVISMPTTSEWVDVQSVAVGERRSVRTLRYRETNNYGAVPAAEMAALGGRQFSIGVSAARLAAATPVSAEELLDVTRRLDVAAVEGWLAQQQIGFRADAGQLVKLADAGLPSSLIDVVVALSYPERFTVAAVEPKANNELLGPIDRSYGPGGGYYDPFWDPFYGSRFDRRYYSPFGYSLYDGYGGYGRYGRYGYGVGYPSRPVVIIVTPDSAAAGGGRVVKGRGYTRRADTSPEPTSDRRRADSDGPSSSGARGSGSAGTSSTGRPAGASSGGSSSGGSSSGERTAKRRPPPGDSN